MPPEQVTPPTQLPRRRFNARFYHHKVYRTPSPPAPSTSHHRQAPHRQATYPPPLPPPTTPMSSIKSLHTTTTPHPPSCVLFAPSNPSLIILGTYTLHESATTLSSQKTGSLLLYEQTPHGLNLLQTLPCQAVLDIKFSPHDGTLLGVAMSLGRLAFYRLMERERGLVLVGLYEVAEESVLVLSLTFSPAAEGIVAVSLSSGEVALFDVAAGAVTYQYRPHELEAWTVEFAAGGKVLYSGGDDSVFSGQDVGGGVQVWRDRKTHAAGVTAVLAGGVEEGRVLTGSYDEWMRVFDERSRGVVGDVRLGGGVWRLMMRDEGSVLASCMHAGARVVALGEGGRVEGVAARFEEHESMNYGSHVHAGRRERVASCSFYDRRLCIWSI